MKPTNKSDVFGICKDDEDNYDDEECKNDLFRAEAASKQLTVS